jgi:hypothetical protein
MKPSVTTRAPERFGRIQVAWCLGILGALVAAAAYFTMLTGFKLYDDEGTLMLGVKEYLDGMRIYKDIFSTYGPVYYFYNALVRTVTSTPVSHDATRISSVIPWVGVSLLCGWITLRLTKSLVLAATSVTAVSMATRFFRNEPGHPQELALLLVVAVVACPLCLDLTKRSTTLMITLGSLVGMLLLIKVNIGIFVLASLALALLAQGPPGRIGRALGYAVSGGCILLPVALMWNHLDAGWAREYCVVVTASISGAVFCLFPMWRHCTVRWRDCLLSAVGCALTVAVTMAVLAAQGVSMGVVLDSLVFLPYRISVRHHNWYHAPPGSSPAWALWAAVGLGLALYTVWKRPSPGSPEWRHLLRIKAALTPVMVVAIPLRLNLLALVTPFAWLVLFHPDEKDQEAQSFPRTLLCTVTILQTLIGFPIFGSQGLFIQCLLIVLVLVCAYDSLAWITGFGTRPRWFAHWGHAIAVGALAAIILLNFGIVLKRYHAYRALPALDLPGARQVHVEAEVKEHFEPLVSAIRRSCDAFESLPGLPSLNFWTEEYPLTGLNVDAWTLVLSAEQQGRVIAALSRHPRACIVYNPRLSAFWNPGGEDLEVLPLVQYIRQGFRPTMVSGEYQLLIRNARSWNPAESSEGETHTP